MTNLPLRTVIVVDDQLALDTNELGKPSRHNFLESVGSSSMAFRFCTGWDPSRMTHTVEVVTTFVKDCNPDESILLLDVMFKNPESGQSIPLGRDILLRLRSEFPNLPIVMMTYERPENDGHEYLQMGAVDYLIKPIDERRFWRTIRRYIDPDIKHWLIGHNDLFQGAVFTTALLAEKQSHMVVQGGTEEERSDFSNYFTHCAQRNRIFSINIQETTEKSLIQRLFGRSISTFSREVTPEDNSLLHEARGGVIRLVGADSLPRGCQNVLTRFLDTQPTDKSSVLFVADAITSLARLASEDRMDRKLLELLNGNQPANIPPETVRGYDLLHRLALVNGSCSKTGLAYDQFDEQAFDDALARVPIAKFNRWVVQMTALCGVHRKQPLALSLQEISCADIADTSSTPTFYEKNMIEAHAATILMDIRLRELGLLLSAFQHAGGNRARAASMLKDTTQGRTSTLSFDRWFQQVWKTFPPPEQAQLRAASVELNLLCSVLGI